MENYVLHILTNSDIYFSQKNSSKSTGVVHRRFTNSVFVGMFLNPSRESLVHKRTVRDNVAERDILTHNMQCM